MLYVMNEWYHAERIAMTEPACSDYTYKPNYFAYYFGSLYPGWQYRSYARLSSLRVLPAESSREIVFEWYQRWEVGLVLFYCLLLIVCFYFFHILPPLLYIGMCLVQWEAISDISFLCCLHLHFSSPLLFFSFDLCPLRLVSRSPVVSISFLVSLLPPSSVSTLSSFRGYWFLLSIGSSNWIQTRPFA